MSLEAIRVDIATAVATAASSFSTYPLVVEYPNRELIDLANQVNPFIRLQIKILEGEQVDLSDAPMHRFSGQIHLACATQVGQGVVKVNQALDHMYKLLQRRKLGTYVRTHMSVPAPMLEHNGWCYYPVVIPFWADIPT